MGRWEEPWGGRSRHGDNWLRGKIALSNWGMILYRDEQAFGLSDRRAAAYDPLELFGLLGSI